MLNDFSSMPQTLFFGKKLWKKGKNRVEVIPIIATLVNVNTFGPDRVVSIMACAFVGAQCIITVRMHFERIRF